MTKAINFDMDGTLADFYGVDNWLEYLVNKDAYPYAAAKPLMNMSLTKYLSDCVPWHSLAQALQMLDERESINEPGTNGISPG